MKAVALVPIDGKPPGAEIELSEELFKLLEKQGKVSSTTSKTTTPKKEAE